MQQTAVPAASKTLHPNETCKLKRVNQHCGERRNDQAGEGAVHLIAHRDLLARL